LNLKVFNQSISKTFLSLLKFTWLWLAIPFVGIMVSSAKITKESTAIKENLIEVATVANPTFAEHIAPIVHQHCMPCHRPGEAGPFSLINYRDVKKRAKMVRLVTQKRIMPPWPAAKNYGEFVHEKGLNDEQIALIARWVAQGAALGDSNKLPTPPDFPTGSQLATPDFVLRVREPIKIPGTNTDHFFMVKIPYELPWDTVVRCIEFVPGHRKITHHVNGHLIQYENGKKKSLEGGKWVADISTTDQLSSYKELDLLNDDGSFPTLVPLVSNYLPGYLPPFYPEGIGGFRIKKRGLILINDIHYGATSETLYDGAVFNIFLAKKPTKRWVRETQLGTLGVSKIVPPLSIPPNQVSTHSTYYQTKEDISILAVSPHMHLLGKSFQAFAITPSADTIPLIHIPKWDFRWQYYYTFKRIVKIPTGSTIKAIGVFDNTENNPLNPFFPPQLVGEREGSMRTSDEMLQFIFHWTKYEAGDEQVSLE